MVIKHNLPAENAHRQNISNKSKIAKDIEKLSSGLRINKSADDASGLAVSEKMRAQIRGLDQACRNVLEGINLVQVGDGGMEEIHTILRRMNELSVAAMNGTYSDEDRGMMEQEVIALNSEIDRIANSTHFNGIYMLNATIGSGSGGDGSEGDTIVQGLFADQFPINQDTPHSQGVGGVFGENIDVKYEIVDGKIIINGSSDGIELGNVAEELSENFGFNNVLGGSGDDKFNSVTRTDDGGYLFVGTTQSNNGDVPSKAYDVSRDGHKGTNKLIDIVDVDTISGYDPGWKQEGTTPWNSDYSPKQWILKMDSEGEIQWSTAIGDSGGKGYGKKAVELANGNYAIMGNVTNEWGMQMHTSISVLDRNGNMLSNELYHPNGVGDMKSAGSSDIVAVDDGFVVVGNARYASDNYQPALAKFDLNGIFKNKTLLPAEGHSNVSSVKKLANGNLVLVGNTKGGYYSQNGTTPSGNQDIWVATLDQNFKMLSSRTYGSAAPDSANNVIVMDDGGYAVSGHVSEGNGSFVGTKGAVDAFIMRFDASGNVLWKETYGGVGDEIGMELQLDEDGNITMVATTTSDQTGDVGTSLGGKDGWIVKVDASNGSIIQSKNLGGPGEDTISSMTSGADGSYLLGGSVTGFGGDIGDDAAEDAIRGFSDVWLAAFTGFGDKVIELPLGNIVLEKDAAGNATKWIEFDGCTSVVSGDGKTIKSLSLSAKLLKKDTPEIEEPDIEVLPDIIIQCGANAADIFVITRADMRTQVLFNNKAASIATIKDANQTLDMVTAAIDQVSVERAKFGAYQNAMEHIMSNVANSAENLTAAESRIRDADIAKLMMSFMEENILSQASQTMLAQANMLPQNVMQLLTT